ncbi:hypothetical protein CW745_09645 [Psychromonas sp. psych-6C06]|uniref:hypothetical protein n=1 Tax=Psychromonas sp. psych-6C06 TaxID=2058089 RepID=UPI000C34A456|nr:hypothetical protein [Psychromonas sp. psych-6C06]PKF61580.1 hypothetical protein CW745_09645 [Psychromonas sp. psych-6C06]
MHSRKIPHGSTPKKQRKTNDQIEALLREARILHRVAKAGTISQALPILRRLKAAGAGHNQSLSTLFNQRNTLQRKHFLRVLALEAGYPSWEKYKPALLTKAQQTSFDFAHNGNDIATLNLWFSSHQEAQEYAKLQGGRVLNYGQQAVVIADNSSEVYADER